MIRFFYENSNFPQDEEIAVLREISSLTVFLADPLCGTLCCLDNQPTVPQIDTDLLLTSPTYLHPKDTPCSEQIFPTKIYNDYDKSQPLRGALNLLTPANIHRFYLCFLAENLTTTATAGTPHFYLCVRGYNHSDSLSHTRSEIQRSTSGFFPFL